MKEPRHPPQGVDRAGETEERGGQAHVDEEHPGIVAEQGLDGDPDHEHRDDARPGEGLASSVCGSTTSPSRVSDIAAALEWWSGLIPGERVLYADETWGLLEAGGAKLAFVTADQHPHHLALKVSAEELERLAAEHGVEIAVHRDASRSFYLDAPGDAQVEVIAYPDTLEEDAE